MFSSLRWRLTFWFICLTTVVYALSTFCAIGLFHAGLSALIKEEVEALVSEIVPAIDLRSGTPTLHEWASTFRKHPFKSLPTIQIFDHDGKVIEEHGPAGIPELYKHEGEVQVNNHAFFVHSTPLIYESHVIGYLQVELSLMHRDQTTMQFAITMASVAPFLLFALGLAGYLFSSKAAQPLEDSLLILRRFMTDAGHELSTPITIIQANAEAMEVDIEHNEAAENRLAVISRASERMGKLVQDLMLLSKMESPQLETKRVPLDFDKLVKNILEEFDELFKAKGVELQGTSIQTAPIYGDPESLKRLVTNLLQNALRYTESGGAVSITVESTPRYAKLKVADTGIGIPAESLPLIFDRFYRVDKSRSRQAGGVGLGLSIVKAIVDAHKGKMEVQSKVDVGTTFSIVLPMRGL
ncbi:MAG TPA: HAMP domain-containing sensor histidine kinase [Drouetiella sp.]